MARYRLTHAAQADIVSILASSHDQFGEEARKRYEALIATAIREASKRSDEVGGRSAPSWVTGCSPGIWRGAVLTRPVELCAARGTS